MVHSVLLMSGHEFVGLNSFLFVALILVCLVLGGLIKRYNFHYLPESGGSMLFGLVCGGLLNLGEWRSGASAAPVLVIFALHSHSLPCHVLSSTIVVAIVAVSLG